MKSSQDAQALQRMQSTHSSSPENAAAQLAALIRRAAAAQGAADSAQQQLSQATQAHVRQMADAWAVVKSTQQELGVASDSFTQLQQELVATKQSHADQVVVLQRQHADQVAVLQKQHTDQLEAFTTGFNERGAMSQAELSEVKSSLAVSNEQHAKSLAELQQHFDSTLAAADSKHALMLTTSQAELAAARQQNIQQWLVMEQRYKDTPQVQHSRNLPHPQSHHFSALAQAYSQPSSAEAKRPSDEAHFVQLSAMSSLQAELMPLKQHSSQAAAPTANSDAQGVTAGEFECTSLRQSLAALEQQLAAAQAEILVHASTSVGRFELVCRLTAAQQGTKHCWASSDHWQQMQQLIQGVAAAVGKKKQADSMKLVADDSQSTQQHAVTSACVAEAESSSVPNYYPSDEDDLDDWTQEEDDSDAACTQQTDSTGATADNSHSILPVQPISSGDAYCTSSGFPQSDQQKLTDATTKAQADGNEVDQHARQTSVASSHAPEDASGAKLMPASNTGISSRSEDVGCATGGSSGVMIGAGVAQAESSCVDCYPSEENDLDDWTCDEDAESAHESSSCVPKNAGVAEAKSSSVPNYYPSDEDDLDDWTCDEDAASAYESSSCVPKSAGVAEAKSSSVPNYYPSDEDDLDDWTNEDDELFE